MRNNPLPAPIIRAATHADIEAFADHRNKPSIRAVCMELEGRIIALGGIAWARGRWIGFADLSDEARRYKMHISRAALRFLSEAKRSGVRFIYAGADPCEARAIAWLTSLGFKLDPRSRSLYRWSATPWQR